jgi:hypothetical protein
VLSTVFFNQILPSIVILRLFGLFPSVSWLLRLLLLTFPPFNTPKRPQSNGCGILGWHWWRHWRGLSGGLLYDFESRFIYITA